MLKNRSERTPVFCVILVPPRDANVILVVILVPPRDANVILVPPRDANADSLHFLVLPPRTVVVVVISRILSFTACDISAGTVVHIPYCIFRC